jgi:hypothetical protein
MSGMGGGPSKFALLSSERVQTLSNALTRLHRPVILDS